RENLETMYKKIYWPKIGVFADIGSQSENMRVNRYSGYTMVGAQLTWPIFEGNRNRLRIREGHIAVMEAKNELEEGKQKLDLSLSMAENELLAARANLLSARKQVEAVETYHRLVSRGYSEGVYSYLEMTDARTQFTSSRLILNLAGYRLMSALADYE